VLTQRDNDKKKAKAEDTRRVRERKATQDGSKTSKLGLWGEKQSDKIAAKKKAQGGRVFNPAGMTDALRGEKKGNLGVNLDNSKHVQAVDKHHEDKRNAKKAAEQPAALHARLDAVGGNEKLLSKADQRALRKERANARMGIGDARSRSLKEDVKRAHAKIKADKARAKAEKREAKADRKAEHSGAEE